MAALRPSRPGTSVAETDSSRRPRARVSTRPATIAAAAVSHGAAPAGARSQCAASARHDSIVPANRHGHFLSAVDVDGPNRGPGLQRPARRCSAGAPPLSPRVAAPPQGRSRRLVALRRRRATRRGPTPARRPPHCRDLFRPGSARCARRAVVRRRGRRSPPPAGHRPRSVDPSATATRTVQTTEPNPLPRCSRVFAGTMQGLRPHETGTRSPQRRPCGPGEPSHDAVLALRGAKITRAAVEPETRDRERSPAPAGSATSSAAASANPPNRRPAANTSPLPSSTRTAVASTNAERSSTTSPCGRSSMSARASASPRLPHRDPGQHGRRPTCEIVAGRSGSDARPGTALRPRPVAAGRRASWRATPSTPPPLPRPPTPRPMRRPTPTRARRPRRARAPTSRQPSRMSTVAASFTARRRASAPASSRNIRSAAACRPRAPSAPARVTSVVRRACAGGVA